MRIHGTKTQEGTPPWGLGRIAHKKGGNRDYKYDKRAGKNSVVYMLDTGIYTKNPDFEDRAVWGTNKVGGEDTDENGHGTNTASLVAGRLFGVAKKAKVVAVKVLNKDGRGPASDIISGIEWATKDAKKHDKIGKAIMNISIGSSKSDAVNDAVNKATEAGITVFVSAGHEDQDAANVSPASAKKACTIAASNKDDVKAGFSNYGKVGK